MSLVEVLHRAHVERQQRFARAAREPKQKPKPASYFIPNSPLGVIKKPPPKPQPVIPPEWVARQQELHEPVRRPRPVKIEQVQRVVCEHFGSTMMDMISQRRAKAFVRPRQVAVYLCRHLTLRSFPEIGRKFGNRDHTTMLASVRKVEELMEADEQFRASIEMLTEKLGGEPV